MEKFIFFHEIELFGKRLGEKIHILNWSIYQVGSSQASGISKIRELFRGRFVEIVSEKKFTHTNERTKKNSKHKDIKT
ncbi:MAG: hypothetical protein K9L24_03160 [Spirochaetia bacterium]|nr:hypothetical protein [Spirochaetia bacterium]